IGRLIIDALHCEPERAQPLARLVQEKTGGNPFFAIQFLTALAEEGLLAFDRDSAAWVWHVARIRAKRYTDNIADHMAGKLNRLPASTQKALQQLACLGPTSPPLSWFTENQRRRSTRHCGTPSAQGLSSGWRTPTHSSTIASKKRLMH